MHQPIGMKDKNQKKRSYIFTYQKLWNCSPTLTCHSVGTVDSVNSPVTLYRSDGFSSNYVIEIYEK